MKHSLFTKIAFNAVVLAAFTALTASADSVAKIGETKYETLADAITAAEAGETVTMLDDVVLTEKQTIDKAITLDLNGKTISSTVGEFITIESTGNLTINDATNKGRIENTSTSGNTIKVLTGASSGGILTVTGGSIVAHVANNAAVYSQSYGSTKMAINVKGGRIENDGVNSYAVKLGSDTGTINVSCLIGIWYTTHLFSRHSAGKGRPARGRPPVAGLRRRGSNVSRGITLRVSSARRRVSSKGSTVA